MSKTIAVTGANGFIGRHLVEYLANTCELRCAVRSLEHVPASWAGRFSIIPVGPIGPITEWTDALDGVDTVIHLAATAHRSDLSAQSIAEVNVDGVQQLVTQAAGCGVRRIVFVSTIGVHGSQTHDSAFDESSPMQPHDEYAASKCQAEAILKAASAQFGLEFVIVRPPLVYGPRAPGNFARLVALVRRGLPLPLAAVRNSRSLLSVANLCDFLGHVTSDFRAANQTFVVCDGEDISVPGLLRCMYSTLGRKAKLFYVPTIILRWSFVLLGRRSDFGRLCASLRIDARKAHDILDWHPPQTLADGLRLAILESERSRPLHSAHEVVQRSTDA